MKITRTLSFILNHPINKDRKSKALLDWFKWQVGSRLVPGPVAVSFVNNTVLLVGPGMTGATGNVYTGLHEFEDMAFVLHLLRKDDLFVDVGANVGSYTVLAGGVAGAKCIAIEPINETFAHLLRNIALNDIRGLIDTHNIGIGPKTGVLSFTTQKDTMNHVRVEPKAEEAGVIEVQADSLDNVVGDRSPLLIKIDVEGFEKGVIEGGQRVLSRDSLAGVILELNGSGRRYGFEDSKVHEMMLAFGFRPFRYSPFERRLSQLDNRNTKVGNTIYVRNPDFVFDRLTTAPKFRVRGHEI